MRTVRLGDVARTKSGGTPSRGRSEYFGGPIRWAKIQDLTRAGRVLQDTEETISTRAVADLRLPLFQPGTVLLSMYGSIGVASIAGVPTSSNQAILGIEPSAELDGGYLWLYLQLIAPSLAATGRGGTQRNINASMVRNILIPLPAPGFQRTFAAAVARQLSDTADLLSRTQARLEASLSLRKNTIGSALRGGHKDLRHVLFRDLLSAPMRTGISGPPADDSGMPGLSIAAVHDGVLDLRFSKRVTVSPSTNRLVREGAFYIVRGNGRLQLVGRGGIAPRPENPTVFPDLLIEARVDPDRVAIDYLALVWDGDEVRTAIEARARTATGIFKINLHNLGAVPVPIPPIAEQRRIAAELRNRLATIDQMTRAIETQLEAIDALPAALLRRAFAEIKAA